MVGRLKFLLPIAVFAGMFTVFYKGLYSDPTLVSSPFIDKAAPAFNLPTLYDEQKRITEAEFSGKISLLNVWASWCPGCAREHDMLLTIARETGVPIYGLNWKDERRAALQWLQERGNPYAANAVDRDNVTGIDWGVYGAPETFLIDSAGVIRYKHIGPLTQETWEAEFVPRIETARAAHAGTES